MLRFMLLTANVTCTVLPSGNKITLVQPIQATKQAIDPNLKLIESLQAELDLVGLSNRERSIEQAVRRLSADATDEQKDKVRELATALYDEKAAVEASTRAQQVLGNLRQQLANLNAGSGDLAAAQAALLARQIQDGREARQVIDSVRDGAERYEQELNKLNHLLEVGAIDHQTYERAAEQAYERMLAALVGGGLRRRRPGRAGVRRRHEGYGGYFRRLHHPGRTQLRQSDPEDHRRPRRVFGRDTWASMQPIRV
ncbi:MAG: hypothetical protein WCO00_18260, partial [Rhodospirillaceae bacterium]